MATSDVIPPEESEVKNNYLILVTFHNKYPYWLKSDFMVYSWKKVNLMSTFEFIVTISNQLSLTSMWVNCQQASAHSWWSSSSGPVHSFRQ